MGVFCYSVRELFLVVKILQDMLNFGYIDINEISCGNKKYKLLDHITLSKNRFNSENFEKIEMIKKIIKIRRKIVELCFFRNIYILKE